MPHICTRCNNVFESGEDILKGCPVCGWKKFMFTRSRTDNSGVQQEQIITRAMGVRIPPGRGRKEKTEMLHEGASITEEAQPKYEAQAQISWRDRQKEKILRREDEAQVPKGREGAALESIKITAPGTYELNLPSLFERDELIMAVKEGTYFIDLTSAFKKSKKD
ncbi:Zn-ribbon containing protein [uncultured archaeon]|nr:Zn-ribbon containing protein [uncultured archaeon]